MKLLIISIFIQISISASAQTKIYKLLDITEKATTDNMSILGISKLSPGFSLLDGAFKPIKGNHTVYRFICTFKGISYSDEKEFHELLVLETDKNNIIVKGYFYELELYDPPSYNAIYQYSGKGVYLKDKMNLNEIKFIRPKYDDPLGRKLHEEGIIRLKSMETRDI